MNLKLKYFLICLLTFPFAVNAFGQVAAFTQDTLEGCGQQTINFTNQSTGATSYIWRFGDGNISTSSAPTVTENYVNVGTYTVTLVAINGSSRDSVSKTINIWRNPDAIFIGTPPLHGCVPLNVAFTDQSVNGDGVINSWAWDFGDGYGSAMQNPTHSFANAGIWSIYLKVEDSHGCTDWDTLNNYVNVSNPPIVGFTANSTINCTVPFPVTFSNTSTGYGALQYSWDFGDGGTSNLQAPAYTYTVAGTYTVKLVVTDANGCKDSLIIDDYIKITPVTAAFHFLPGDSVCQNEVVNFFSDAGGINVLWGFGDPTSGGNNSSTLQNPTHSFAASGLYVITLIADPGGACQAIIHDTVIVRVAPLVSFSLSSHYYCGGDSIIFNNTSPDAVYFSWDFGDQLSSNNPNPYVDYIHEGTYYPSLTITDSHGCVGEFTDTVPVKVDFPEANIEWDSDSLPNHCIPFPVDFTGSGNCYWALDSISVNGGYSWNFGDTISGLLNTSQLQEPVHIFNDTGEYTITLTVITDVGCTAKDSIEIKIGSHQIPIIDYAYTGGCANDTSIHFISMSTDSNLIDFWQWTFISHFDTDSAFDIASSSETHPTVDFHGNDSISIQLIVGFLECKDTLIDTNAFLLDGPYLRNLDTLFSCETPLHMGFTVGFIKQATRWEWDFNDDGVADYNSAVYANPVYVYNDTVWYDYPSRGTYKVRLKAYNDTTGCFYEDSLTFQLLVIDAFVNATTPNCYNNNAINMAGSVDWENPGQLPQNSIYSINYGDGQIIPYTFFNTFSPYQVHNFPTQSGVYNVILTMTNRLGCVDSDTTTIQVYYPVAGFTMSQDSGCSPLPVHFTDTSHSDIPYTLTWFSGGLGSVTGTSADFNYINPGTYSASLQLTDSIGCISLAPAQMITVLNLPPDFSAIDSTICLGDSVYFNSTVPYTTGFSWDFGDGMTASTSSPNFVHLYADTGTYTVSLLNQSTLLGCDGSVIKPSFIRVQDIVAKMTVTDSISTCYPFMINITNQTNTLYSPNWNWSFGDGGTGNQFEPIHNYTLPGNYWLYLNATTTPETLFGCTSKDSVLIQVGGPYAEISYSDTSICKGESVTFALINDVGVTSFNWSFGDGGGGNTTPFTYQFNYVPPTGLTKVYLIYQSDVNCQKKDSAYINIYQVMANFNYLNSLTGSNDSVICQPGILDFYNYSLGADSMIWNLGDGQYFTSTDSAVVPGTHTYYNTTPNNIDYNITLTVYNSEVGCVDSITKHYTVYSLPQMTVSNDVSICAGNAVQLSVTNTNPVWSPSDGLSNITSANPWATPDSSTLYHVTITDSHQCVNSDSVFVFVQQIPELNHNSDTTIIIGEYVDMLASSDQSTVTYNWTPSYGLSCTTCSNPVAQPLQTTTYTVEIVDSMKCDTIRGQITITVKEEYSLDVPSAFTPNNDGDNDLVYVRGWGIKNLVEFKIYNRWGECIFETDDMQQGWDGTFKGIKQNIDTYAYTAKAATYSGKILTKNGLINLLR
ncbi:MAG: PKD domain-containing protein [Bacteroidia bacterium]|nr:PKD domain-containing protein [Bacteroidia bacterium]